MKFSSALMILILSIILIIVCQSSFSQETYEGEKVYTIAEEMPTFKDCFDYEDESERIKCTTWYLDEYFRNNMRYSNELTLIDLEKNNEVKGSFIVDKFGLVKKARIDQGLKKEDDEEALRLINSLPRFSPGIDNGIRVNVRMIVTIDFESPVTSH